MFTSRYRTIMLFVIIGIILSTIPCAACSFRTVVLSFTDWCIIGTLTLFLFVAGITTTKKAIVDGVILIISGVFAYILYAKFNYYIIICYPVIIIIFAVVIGRRIVSKYKELNKKNIMFTYLTLIVILAFYFHSNVVTMGCSVNCIYFNLKILSNSLEMYADDHETKYPASLSELSPKYLKEIPECTPYITRFSLPPHPKSLKQYGPVPYQYEVNSTRDHYTITCKSRNHDFIYGEPGLPYYSSTKGVITIKDQ